MYQRSPLAKQGEIFHLALENEVTLLLFKKIEEIYRFLSSKKLHISNEYQFWKRCQISQHKTRSTSCIAPKKDSPVLAAMSGRSYHGLKQQHNFHRESDLRY